MPKRFSSDTVTHPDDTGDDVDLSFTPAPEPAPVTDGSAETDTAQPVADAALAPTSPSARARRLGGPVVAPPAAATKPGDAVRLTKPSSADQLDEAVRRGRGVAGRPAARQRPEPAAAPATPPAKRRLRPTRTGIIAGVLLLLAIVLGVVNLLVWHPWNKPNQTAEVRGQILSTVNQSVANVITYNYKTWDADAQRAQAGLGGQFKTDYTNAMKGSLKNDATTTQTVVVGKVNSSGLVSVNKKGTEATVAVYAQTSKTNTTNPDPTTSLLGVQVIVDKTNGKWLITKLSYIK